MIYHEDYNISFVSLSEGRHFFDYHIDGQFFEELEFSPIKKSDINVDLIFHKHANFFNLNFDINGTVKVPCDRCLEMFDFPISNQYQLIVKFEDDHVKADKEDETQIMYIDTSATYINVAQPIYEYINLSLPIKRIHPDGNCNKKVIEKLEELSPDSDNENEIDPRWEKLKQIKKKHYGSS